MENENVEAGSRSGRVPQELEPMEDAAYAALPVETMRELLRQAELRQQALLTMAAAADARAMQLLAGSATMAAGLLAAGAALLGTGAATGLAWAAIGAGAMFTAAAACAALASRPEPDYSPPGAVPSAYWAGSFLGEGEKHLLYALLGDAQLAISKATHGSIARGRWATLASWALVAAAPIGAMAGLVRHALG